MKVTGVAVYHGFFSLSSGRCGHNMILTTEVGRIDAWSFGHPTTESETRAWVISQVRCLGYLIEDSCPMHVEAMLHGHDGS